MPALSCGVPYPATDAGLGFYAARSYSLIGSPRSSASSEVCRAITRTRVLSWCFLCSLGCSPVLADQALGDVGALDAGGKVGGLAGFVQRGPLFPRLVRPVLVLVPRVLGQDPAEVPFSVDQQVIEALAP